jgi:hypothetical protein
MLAPEESKESHEVSLSTEYTYQPYTKNKKGKVCIGRIGEDLTYYDAIWCL